MLTITCDHPYYKNHSERKLQANIYPSDQIFKKEQEELIEFNEKQNDKLRKFSSEHIQNEVLTLTSGTLYSEDWFERKSQAKLSPSNQSFEQP